MPPLHARKRRGRHTPRAHTQVRPYCGVVWRAEVVAPHRMTWGGDKCTPRFSLWKTLWKMCKLLFEVRRRGKRPGKIYKFVISCGKDLL